MSFDWVAASAGYLGGLATLGGVWWTIPHLRQQATETAAANDIELERQRLEHEAIHEDRAPKIPGVLEARLRRTPATDFLAGSITVDRTYRVHAEARIGETRQEIALQMVLHPGRPYEFVIEKWPAGKKSAVTEEILFKFWPPLAGDGVEVWTCPCDEPTGEDMRGSGHWQRLVAVHYERLPAPRLRWLPSSPEAW